MVFQKKQSITLTTKNGEKIEIPADLASLQVMIENIIPNTTLGNQEFLTVKNISQEVDGFEMGITSRRLMQKEDMSIPAKGLTVETDGEGGIRAIEATGISIQEFKGREYTNFLENSNIEQIRNIQCLINEYDELHIKMPENYNLGFFIFEWRIKDPSYNGEINIAKSEKFLIKGTIGADIYITDFSSLAEFGPRIATGRIIFNIYGNDKIIYQLNIDSKTDEGIWLDIEYPING